MNHFSTTAGSNFNGATVTLNRQFQDDFELLAGYTYSKTINDASSDLEQPQIRSSLARKEPCPCWISGIASL